MRSLAIGAFVAGLAIGASQEGRAEQLKAGVATIDITPPMSLKATLGGYGARMSKPAVGVHDRVFAKALVLSDGTKRFVLVTADVLAFPPPLKPALVNRLAAEGWSRDHILLLASHSHTSIEMNAINPNNTLDIPQIGLFNRDLFELTVANLAAVIRKAGRNLVPVKLGTSTVPLAGWNRNRRDGETTTDQDLTVTRIDGTDGTPLVALVNWTAHPTFMAADDMMFSGGWPGHLQRTLEALIGNGVTAMYYNGSEGDQAPVARPNSGNSNWEKAERYGRELGVLAWRQWAQTETQASARFAFHLEEIRLPTKTWHPDFQKTGGAEYGIDERNMQRILDLLVPPTTSSGSLRLGDLIIVGVPGEMTAQLGMNIKKRVREKTGADHIAIGGLANEWVSYILSPEQYRRGGYESSVSLYGAELGPTIVEGAARGAMHLEN